MDPLNYLNDKNEELRSNGLFRWPRLLEGEQAPIANYDGTEVINLCSNNYLGFANHPEIKERAKGAIDKYGVSPVAVRTIAGNMKIHIALEEKLAEFKKVEKVLLFQSGFAANVSTISAILGPDDTVVSDQNNNTAVIDGCRLSEVKPLTFNHADIKHAREMLEQAAKEPKRKILLITDGVFSVDGDIAKLPELVKLARKYNAILMTDDAHASGVLGRNGRGSVDHFNLHGDIDIQVGSLSKAFAAIGGYVAGSKDLIDYLIHSARPILFSTSLPPPVTATVLAGLDLIQKDNSFLERLWQNTRYFKEGLKQLGFETGNSQTPIIPIMVGEERKAVKFADRLFEEGIFAAAVASPFVTEGEARVRTTVTAGHKKEDLNKALDAFEKVGKELAII